MPGAVFIGCPLGMRRCWHPREKARVREGNFCKAAFISTVRRPRGAAYVSSHVDADTSMPWHLMICLRRRESQEMMKIGGTAQCKARDVFFSVYQCLTTVGISLKKAEKVLKYLFHCFSGKRRKICACVCGGFKLNHLGKYTDSYACT